MIRRPPRSTQSRSSAASDVYKRQPHGLSATTSSVEARAHLRHSLRLDNRDDFHWNRTKEENVSLIKGTHDALKKGSILPWKRANQRISPSNSVREGVILLVTSPWQLVSEKQGEFLSELIQTRSYPHTNAKRLADLHNSSANSSQSRIGSEAELNHHCLLYTSPSPRDS